MAFELEKIQEKVNAHLQDDAEFLTPDEVDEAIDQAVIQVSHDKPFLKVFDLTGDNTDNLALPSDFERGFSDLKEVEFEIDNVPPSLLDRGDDFIGPREDPTKAAGSQQRLLFVSTKPATGKTVRITYTTSHTVTKTTSTLNQTQFAAVIYKTLVFCFRAIAGKFGQDAEPTIAADAVNRSAQEFLFLSERWEGQYKQIIGFGEKEITADHVLDEADVIFKHGEDFIFHQARLR